MTEFTLDDLRLDVSMLRAYAERRTWPRRFRKRFIRAMPLPWVTSAARLPGAALQVALVLAWRAGHERQSANLTVPTSWLDTFGVSRHAYYRALQLLEDADLITVTRRSGCKARVTLVVVD